MSESEAREIEVEAHGQATEPEAALREALSSLANGLATSRAAPFHLTAMTWTAPDIEAMHPRRHIVDRIYREVFGGFRPPIRLVPGDGRRLVVRAHAAIPPPRQQVEPPWHGHP